ncbi:MAG: GNAT family N-acetyltransferase, partial [Pseudomonadota bacterium]
MTTYTFIPMTLEALPMFKAWLEEPHIDGWWGEPGTEARLVEEDMEEDRVDMRLACADGTPFAYIQDYNAHAFGAPQYEDQPEDARAIDTFLGNPAFLGKGHGAGYIAARLAELRKD